MARSAGRGNILPPRVFMRTGDVVSWASDLLRFRLLLLLAVVVCDFCNGEER
jgi:hypothetical protein